MSIVSNKYDQSCCCFKADSITKFVRFIYLYIKQQPNFKQDFIYKLYFQCTGLSSVRCLFGQNEIKKKVRKLTHVIDDNQKSFSFILYSLQSFDIIFLI